jgi:hypothetical protein
VLIKPNASDTARWAEGWYDYRTGDEFRLEGVDSAPRLQRGQHLGVTSWQRLSVYREERKPPSDPAWEHMLPLGLIVEPKSTERLVREVAPVGHADSAH